jgi:hypothetical protein
MDGQNLHGLEVIAHVIAGFIEGILHRDPKDILVLKELSSCRDIYPSPTGGCWSISIVSTACEI